MSDIKETLTELGGSLNAFKGNAELSQKLKAVIDESKGPLNATQREALTVIFQKIARILNGDPDHIDSWHDIAGYATLVVCDLEDKQKVDSTPVGTTGEAVKNVHDLLGGWMDGELKPVAKARPAGNALHVDEDYVSFAGSGSHPTTGIAAGDETVVGALYDGVSRSETGLSPQKPKTCGMIYAHVPGAGVKGLSPKK